MLEVRKNRPIDPDLLAAAEKSLAKMMEKVYAIATDNLARLRPALASLGRDVGQDAFAATFDRLKNGELDFRNRHMFFGLLRSFVTTRSLNLVRDTREFSLLLSDQDAESGTDQARAISAKNFVDAATAPSDSELVMEDLLRRLFDSLDNTDAQKILLLRLFSQLIIEDTLIDLMSRPEGDDPLRQALNNIARELNFPEDNQHGIALITRHTGFSEAKVFRNLERIRAKLTELLDHEPVGHARSALANGAVRRKQCVSAYLAKLKSIADGFDSSTLRSQRVL